MRLKQRFKKRKLKYENEHVHKALEPTLLLVTDRSFAHFPPVAGRLSFDVRHDMPDVILHVSGAQFDPDAYLKIVTFKPYRVHKIGEPMKRGRPNATWTDSGFSVALGAKDEDNLASQIEMAIDFVNKHYDELKQLQNIDKIRLDFGYLPRRGEDGLIMFAQFNYFPPEFLRKCGELQIGIELSLYQADNDGEQPASENCSGGAVVVKEAMVRQAPS